MPRLNQPASAAIHDDEREELRRAMASDVWDILVPYMSDGFLGVYATLVAALYVGDSTGADEANVSCNNRGFGWPLKDVRVWPLKLAADGYLQVTANAVARWRNRDPRPVAFGWSKSRRAPKPRCRYRGRPESVGPWVTKDLDKLAARLRSELRDLGVVAFDAQPGELDPERV